MKTAIHGLTGVGRQFLDGPPLKKLALTVGSAAHEVTSVGVIC